MNKLIKMLRLIYKAHSGQLRKNSYTPFVSHPLMVMLKAAQLEYVTEDMMLAAAGHDLSEDTYVTINDIRTEFGNHVAKLVEELTNVYTASAYPNMNRKERKKKELERIKNISKEAKQLKMLDRIHNLEERGLTPQHMRKNYLPESRALAEVVGDADPILYQELTDLIDSIEKELK